MSGTRTPLRGANGPALRFSALTFWALGFVAVGIALATAAAWPVYESPRALVVGVAGGLLGMGVAVLARMLRWGALLAALAAVAMYLIVAVPLAIPSALSSVPAFLGGLRDAVFGVVLGWKQMLTLAPPLGEYQAHIVQCHGPVLCALGRQHDLVLVQVQRRRTQRADLCFPQ